METSARSAPGLDGWAIVFGLFAFGNLANGAWMLVDPVHWFHTLPARVPDFGPLNEHFIRDIGCAFSVVGVVLAGAAVCATWRMPACVVATGFYVFHALVHVLDTMRGLVGAEHWMIDLPGVYVPALLLVGLTVWVAKSEA